MQTESLRKAEAVNCALATDNLYAAQAIQEAVSEQVTSNSSLDEWKKRTAKLLLVDLEHISSPNFGDSHRIASRLNQSAYYIESLVATRLRAAIAMLQSKGPLYNPGPDILPAAEISFYNPADRPQILTGILTKTLAWHGAPACGSGVGGSLPYDLPISGEIKPVFSSGSEKKITRFLSPIVIPSKSYGRIKMRFQLPDADCVSIEELVGTVALASGKNQASDSTPLCYAGVKGEF